MNNWYINDAVLADYERNRLTDNYLDRTRARHSIKERIKALEATIERLENADSLDEDQSWELESAREEIHDLRSELQYE